MADTDYVHGSMDIAEQNRTWDGFIKGTLWGSFMISLVIAYATLTIALGMNWAVALGLCAIGGVVGGMLLGMGSGWIATVVVLTVLAVIVQLLIGLFGAFG